jgi:hypothetical protein
LVKGRGSCCSFLCVFLGFLFLDFLLFLTFLDFEYTIRYCESINLKLRMIKLLTLMNVSQLVRF